MWLPFRDLADDSERRAGAVGFGGITGESLVGEVGIVLERAGRLDDVDAALVAGGRRDEQRGLEEPDGREPELARVTGAVLDASGPDLAERLGRLSTLEDVFMTYTGRSLDDDVEEDESGDDED